MVKAFTLLLALLIGLSFSGMTFAKSLGASSDQLTIQAPQGGDKDKEGEDDRTNQKWTVTKTKIKQDEEGTK